MTSILRHVSPAVLPLLALALGVACSSSTTAQTTQGTDPNTEPSTPIARAECSTRCKSKLSACGAPGPQTEQGCAMLCDGSYSAEQVACFESKGCEELAAAETVEELCPSKPTGKTDAGPTVVKDAATADPLPSKLKVTGDFGTVKATHVLDREKNEIVSVLSVAPKPTFSPASPRDLPQINKGTTKITSPSLGSCKPTITWTLNPSQISVMIIGTDALPDSSCTTFTDAIAKGGLEATIEGAPYSNASSKATVTIHLTP